MALSPDKAALARALARLRRFADVTPDELRQLPRKGLAHLHFGIGARGALLRVPYLGVPDLAYEAAGFRRAHASGRTPRLHATLAPGPGLPFGALVVERVAGRPPRLPADLETIAEALAAIHSLPLPAAEARPPLADPADPFAATLARIERNAAFLGPARVGPRARRQLESELDWAREFARVHASELAATPRALVVTDAHPGNFLVAPARGAVFVDLEKALYGAPAIDLAHASLWPATGWDRDCARALSPAEIDRFHRAYFRAVGQEAERAIAPFLAPMRRLTWLRTTTAFVRFRAEGAAATLAPKAAGHVRRLIAQALAAATIAEIRRRWRRFTFAPASG
ncbi:MAG: aminoglycoside phosphotransferase family protein [Pseudomonadota bacterium]